MDRDWVLIFLIGLGMGGVFYFNEVLLKDMGPLSVALARVAAAAVASWAFLIVTGRNPAVPLSMLLPLVVLGVFWFVMPFLAYPIGQQFVGAGVAAITNAMTPVFTVVISHIWPGGERATPVKVLGVIIGLVGIVFLTLPILQADGRAGLLGSLILLIGPLGFALGFNWVRRISGMSSAVMMTWAFTFAALIVLPIAGILEGAPDRIAGETWVAIGFVGFILTALTFQIGATILPRAGAVKLSTLTYITPISALLLGTLLLGERMQGLHYLGMATIFLALFLIDGALLDALRIRKTNSQ